MPHTLMGIQNRREARTPTRRTTRWIATGALLLGMIVPLWSVSTASAASCPTMEVIGVRGSGETANDYDGYGETVAAVVDRIRSIVPSVASRPVNYDAIAVGYGGASYPKKYKASVATGVTALNKSITDYIAGGCGKTTYIYLVGYSQGAQVVGDVYDGLVKSQKARIGGVALVADPRFNGAQKGSVNVGTYSANLNGIAVAFHAASKRVVDTALPVRSYCAAYDPVCNFTASNAAGCQFDPTNCIHLFYSTTARISGIPYTDAGANYLISRWRRIGPAAPAIGPRQTVLIYGDGDAGEDASGTPNLVAALTALGLTVSTSPTLPADLSSYGQIWHYGIDVPSDAERSALVGFARAGGSLFLTGEWNGCCSAPSANDGVKGVFDQLVVTVGGLTFGPDGLDVTTPNRTALQESAVTPHALTSFKAVVSGSLDVGNVGPSSALFWDGDTYATVGLWDDTQVVGGGRLAIVMDVNWAQTGFGDMTTMPANAQNIAYFLSGNVSVAKDALAPAAGLVGSFTPTPSTRRAGQSELSAGQRP